MLVSLTENKIIDGTEAKAILADAAAAHRHSIPLVVDDGAAAHEEAASLIEAILKGGNSVRHPWVRAEERAGADRRRRVGPHLRTRAARADPRKQPPPARWSPGAAKGPVDVALEASGLSPIVSSAAYQPLRGTRWASKRGRATGRGAPADDRRC